MAIDPRNASPFVPPPGIPLNRAVSDDLIRRLREGDFSPGDRLPGEADLMKEYGVGRNTVREALQGLVAVRLIDVRPRLGARVLATRPETLISREVLAALMPAELTEDLYEVRLLLETEASALAARRATSHDIRVIEECLAEQNASIRRGESAVREDMEFHNAIARASGNSVFPLVLDAAADLLIRDRTVAATLVGAARVTQEQHAAIFEAIRDGKVDDARSLMAEHVMTASGYRGKAEPLLRASLPQTDI